MENQNRKIIETILQDNIKNNDEHYFLLLNQLNKLNFPIAIINDQLDIIFTNSSINQLFKEIELKNFDNLHQIHDCIHLIEELKQHHHKNYPFYFSTKDDQSFGNFILSPEQLVFNNESYHLIYATDKSNSSNDRQYQSDDTTYLKNTEKQLSQDKDKFRTLINNAVDGVAIVDENAKVIFINNAFCQLLQIEEQELLNIDVWEIIFKMSSKKGKDEAYKEQIKGQILQLLKTQSENTVKQNQITILKNSSGEKIHIIESVFTFPTSKGNNIGIFLRDVTDLKQAEKEIQSAYELLTETEKIANFGSWTSNPKTGEGSWSKGSYAIRSASPDIAGSTKNHEHFMHPEDIEPYRKTFKTNLKSKGTEFKQEYRLIDSKGNIKNIEAHYKIQRDKNGEAIFITGIDRDITDQIKAQELIRKSEERFNLAMNAAQDGIWDWNLITNEIYFSPGWKKMLGYEDHELPNDFAVWEELTHPDDVKRAWDLHYAHINGKIPRIELELRMKHKKGHWVDILTRSTAIFNENKQAIRMIGTHTDISESKKILNQLKYQKKLNQQYLDVAGTMLLVLDPDQNVVLINPKGCEILEYEKEEIIGKNWFDHFLPQKGISEIKKVFNTAIKGDIEFVEYYENPILTKRGKEKIIAWHNSVIHDENGKIIKLFSSGNDITEELKYKQELIIAKQKAEESDRLKSTFLANMSHEIRTPMNGIMGFAQLLREPLLEEEEIKQYVDVIERSGKRMLNIINDLIDISKIEAQQMEVVLEETNINVQITHLKTFFNPEAQKKNIELKIHTPLTNEKATILSDREKIYAILTNLIKNAVKFTKKGSVEFGYNDNNNYLEFYVKDTGLGIPKEKQSTIFERFVQADMAHNREFEGAGLGLAIARAYVEMLGGKIWIEKSDEEGTEFRFKIPKKSKASRGNAPHI